MTQAPPTVAAPLAEHLVNARGEVLVLVGRLEAPPVAWRRLGSSNVFGFGFRKGDPRYFRLPPRTIDLAVRQARILVVEMDGDAPSRDTWVGHVQT